MFASVLGVLLFLLAVTVLFARGVGIWGIQVPVAWGFAITNFVWWIGIGHAGTLISAILLLLRQEWRTSINRLAEAMTVFAVAQAALFPILHLGRPWYFYWLLPYPNTMGLPPQFRSPLVWDAFAVITYTSVSTVFWLVGMIPDLATFRDRATNKWVKRIYGIAALGWRGSAQHWRRFHRAYYLVAALVTALVVSVHTIVSFDFAVGDRARVAQHDLPALLRRRRHLLRLRDGARADHPAAQAAAHREHDHAAAHRQRGEGHARQRPDRGLRLPVRKLQRLVQREHLSTSRQSTARFTGSFALSCWAADRLPT